MEQYQGVKFHHCQQQPTFHYDFRLNKLNRWAHLFAQLGLAPVHAAGAYGNHSYREKEETFVITKSSMAPVEDLEEDNYCRVIHYDDPTTTFTYDGVFPPSSECFLHRALYLAIPGVNAILHGHCTLLNINADLLNIPVTEKFCDYGTRELAESALGLARRKSRFFILKDHGFVALGEDIDSAGRLTLEYFSALINILKRKTEKEQPD